MFEVAESLAGDGPRDAALETLLRGWLGPSVGGEWMPCSEGWAAGAVWQRQAPARRVPRARARLEDVLERGPVDAKYALSPGKCRGVLRRADRAGFTLDPALRSYLEARRDAA